VLHNIGVLKGTLTVVSVLFNLVFVPSCSKTCQYIVTVIIPDMISFSYFLHAGSL
jgi:hypothetical protein